MAEGTVPQDRFRRAIRIMVLLMFTELVVVVVLIDVRLDAIEVGLLRARANSTVSVTASYRDASQAARRHDAPREMVGLPSRPTDSDAVPEVLPRLSDRDRREVIEELYRTERVWRRTSGVLQGVASLRKRGMLAAIDAPQQDRIVKLTRDYAGRRVRLELEVMTSDSTPDLDRLRGELSEFDRSEAVRIESELALFLDAASAEQVIGLLVPRG